VNKAELEAIKNEKRIERLKDRLAGIEGKYWDAMHQIAGLKQSRARVFAAWRRRRNECRDVRMAYADALKALSQAVNTAANLQESAQTGEAHECPQNRQTESHTS
jgi:hypothetical protein